MFKGYLYCVSAPFYLQSGYIKLGRTIDPCGRHSTYLTGCPPGFTPSCELDYLKIWETNATTQKQLDILEDKLFNGFLRLRQRRSNDGSTEWFRFPDGVDGIDQVSKFLRNCPKIKDCIIREVPLTEIRPIIRPKRYMQQYYYKNTDFITEESERIIALNNVQIPVIQKIATFMADPKCEAGYIIAPCGSGKTLMTVRGIEGINKLIICCPSLQIQEQWFDTLFREKRFTEDQMHFIGSAGTTNEEEINAIVENSKFCLITTNISSQLLINVLNPSIQLLIVDEAHHMAGIVSETDEGIGCTRRLFMRATELSIKRLSLTYTPRYIKEGTDDIELSSMDNEELFGKPIVELKIRNLINSGILPDYRLWTLRDEKAKGIEAKGECILEAWNSKEDEKHILHHLIVFTATIDESKQLEDLFQKKLNDTLILRVEGGQSLKEPINQFKTAKRAILINCKVLNEGVDIPIANAVAITYPKQARGEITQMILRAGRWYPDKPLFHVLLPILGEEDLSGFEYVLTALASSDEQIRDEIIAKAATAVPSEEGSADDEYVAPSFLTETIMIDNYEAKPEQIKECFANIRNRIFNTKDSKRIRTLCIDNNIDNSFKYAKLRELQVELPEDPRPKDISWYDYLNPNSKDRMNVDTFKEILKTNNLTVSTMYDPWYLSLKEKKGIPSLQNIIDGYFGNQYDFKKLVDETFGNNDKIRGR